MSTGDPEAHPTPSPGPARPGSIGVLALAAFGAAAVGTGIGRSVLTAYLPLVLERIRDSPFLIGLVMTANPITGVLVPLAVGGPADRVRRHGGDPARAVLLGGVLLGAGGMLAVATLVSTSYPALALAALVTYGGLAAAMTMHRSLVAERFAPPLWARATGAQEIALVVGAMLGLGVGATIAISTPVPFVLGALAIVVVTLPTLGHPLLVSRGAPGVPARPRAGVRVRDYTRILTRPGARIVIAVEALWVFGYAAIPVFFLLYSEAVLGLRPVPASAGLLIFAVIAGAATVLAGSAHELRRQRAVAMASAASLGLGLGWIAIAESRIAVVPGLAAAALGFGAISALGYPLFSAFALHEETGRLTGVFFATRALAAVAALVGAGAAVAITDDYRAVFAMGAVPVLLSLALLTRLRVERSPEPARG